MYLSSTLPMCCIGSPRSTTSRASLDVYKRQVATPVLLGDPFIVLHDGTYYAYGTHADEGIEVYTSDDLKTWKDVYKRQGKPLGQFPLILRCLENFKGGIL